jgi:hypothetical protein
MTRLDQALRALLGFRFVEWQGLPPCLTVDVARIFGTPAASGDRYLGAYPAHWETYSVPPYPAIGLIVYSRASRVVAVETAEPPPLEAASPLGPSDIRKPPELSLPGYVVREDLYYRRGLVLSVAEALDAATTPPVKILRCRGLAVLAEPHEYGAEYYLPLQSRIVF